MADSIGFLSKIIFVLLITSQFAAADRIIRLSEEKRGEVSDFSVVSLSEKYSTSPGSPPSNSFRPSERFVIVMRDSEDKLRFMVWEVSSSGSLNILSNTATDGTIKKVSIARVSSNRVVTAMRDSNNKLRLIVWNISNTGGITRKGTRVGGEISDVDIAGEPDFTQKSPYNSKVITTSIDDNGNLSVSEWKIRSNGEISKPITEVYGRVGQVDSQSSQAPDYIISTAMKDSEDKLRLISFTESDPGINRRDGLGRGGEIREVKTSGLEFGGDVYTVTISEGPIGIRTGLHNEHRLIVDAGLLKVIRWEYNQKGNSAPIDNNPERKHSFEVKETDGLALTAGITNLVLSIGNIDADVVTAHAGFGTYRKLLAKDRGKRRLHLIAWSEDLDITAQATLGGDYTDIEIVPVRPFNHSSRFVTVVRGVRGELKIVAWALNP